MNTLINSDNTLLLFSIMVIIASVAIFLESKFKWAEKITGNIIALVLAMILSNIKIIPTEAKAYDFIWDYVVPLSLPFLLFKVNLRKIWKESGRLFLMYIISSFGTVIGGFIAFFLLKDSIPEPASVSAMMTGTYTGGSVNLVAMADAFKVSSETVSASVVADNLIMVLYFFVLIIIPTLKWFTKRFKTFQDYSSKTYSNIESENNRTIKQISIKDIAKGFSLSFAIVVLSTELSKIITQTIISENIFFEIIKGFLGNKYALITTFSVLLASLKPKLTENIEGTQEMGTFMIYIFFAVIGVPASIYLIFTKAPQLLIFCMIIVFVNMLFSFVFGKIFGFNLEEICLVSNANIGGPTTAAAYAIAKGWNILVAPSLLVGTFGYVLGNYYGIFTGMILGGIKG